MRSIIRYKTIKNTKNSTAAQNAAAQISHDFRLGRSEYANEEKYEDNKVLLLNPELLTTKTGEPFIPFIKTVNTDKPKINFGELFNKAIHEKCNDGYRVKSNAIQALEIMMTISGKVSERFNLDGWIKDSVDWCAEKFGRGNMLFSVLHMDESTPHIHSQIIPIYDGVLNATKHVGTSQNNKKLDSEYFDAVKKYGFEKNKYPSHKRHVPIVRYREKFLAELEKPIPEPQMYETAWEYHDRCKEWLKAKEMEMFGSIGKKEREVIDEMGELRERREALYGVEVDLLKEKQKTEMDIDKIKNMNALLYMMKNGEFTDEEMGKIHYMIREGKQRIEAIEKNKSDISEKNEPVSEPPIAETVIYDDWAR